MALLGSPSGPATKKTPSQTAGSKSSAWGRESISHCPEPLWCNSHLKASWRLPRDAGLFITSRESQHHLREIQLPRKGIAPPDHRDKQRERASCLRQN